MSESTAACNERILTPKYTSKNIFRNQIGQIDAFYFHGSAMIERLHDFLLHLANGFQIRNYFILQNWSKFMCESNERRKTSKQIREWNKKCVTKWIDEISEILPFHTKLNAARVSKKFYLLLFDHVICI